MKRITLANKKLIATLQNTTKNIFRPDRMELIESEIRKRLDKNIPEYEGWEDEYLFEAMKKPVADYGFPAALNGQELVQMPNKRVFEDIWVHIKEIQDVIGIGYHALSCYYPPGGYIGWHHNGNAPGYNILMTYNETGDGWFKYYDMKTKQIIKMEDTPGWSIKVGYYGRLTNEKDKLFWHSAYTKSPRLTISFVTNHLEMWNDIIDDIQTP